MEPKMLRAPKRAKNNLVPRAQLEESERRVSELEAEKTTLDEQLKEQVEANQRLMSYIHDLEKAQEKSEIKVKRMRQDFEEEMKDINFFHEENVARMKKQIDALICENDELRSKPEETVNQLTSKIKKLEKALKKVETKKMEQASKAESDTDLLAQRKEERELGERDQDKYIAEINRLQKCLNDKILSTNDLENYTKNLEEKNKRLTQQLTLRNNPQQSQINVSPRRGQGQAHAETERLQQLLDKEIQAHNNSKSCLRRLQDENQQLKESMNSQEQTTNSIRQRQVKKDRQKYDQLLQEINKKTEECETLKRRISILTCTIQDLKMKTSNPQEADFTEVRIVDQPCQCERAIKDLEEATKAKEELKRQLEKEEKDKLSYKNRLDGIYNEIKRLQACLTQNITENHNLKIHLRASEEKHQAETNQLRGQVKQEQEKNQQLQVNLNRRNKEIANISKNQEEKSALECRVVKLTSELNQEKSAKEKVQKQVRTLEETMEKERAVFKIVVQNCYEAYQAIATKSN